MNCHKTLQYNGEEDLENGYTKEFYTKEIKKLHAAVGWAEEPTVHGENRASEVGAYSTFLTLFINHAQHVQVA